MITVAFVGAGHWGAFFLNLIQNNVGIKIFSILTLENDIISKPSHHIKIHKNDVDYIKYINTDVEFVISAGWPYKIPETFFEQYPIYNIHASLLPAYKGPQPILQQLLNNEKWGGVSIHQITNNWDSGPIFQQIKFQISNNDDHRTLFLKSCRAGKMALIKLFDSYKNNKMEIVKSNYLSSYFKKIKLEDYIIDKYTTFNQFCIIVRAFKDLYPIIAKVNEQFFTIFEYSESKLDQGNIELFLKDKIIYLTSYDYINL